MATDLCLFSRAVDQEEKKCREQGQHNQAEEIRVRGHRILYQQNHRDLTLRGGSVPLAQTPPGAHTNASLARDTGELYDRQGRRASRGGLAQLDVHKVGKVKKIKAQATVNHSL